MSNNDEALFADLFAYRFALLDVYGEGNETEIIRKLKYKLIEWNCNRSQLNNIIFDFYKFYDMNVELEEIENARIILLNFSTYDIFESPTADNSDIYSSFPGFISFLREIREQVLEEERQQQEDVKITVEEEALNNLKIIEVQEELEMNCPICIEGIVKGNEAIKLECNHYFHKDCIKTHLLNYDYKCPLCRCDVGNHKYS